MNRPQQELVRIAAQPDHEIDLARAALAISGLFQREVDPAVALGTLDEMARAASPGVSSAGRLIEKIAALNEVFFDELGFAGNRDAFDDPNNSFLDQVLTRRTGIPISLAAVYIEVAARLDLPVCGVSFPAHFLVRVGRGDSALILDVYSGGVALPEAELDRRLADVYGNGRLNVLSLPSLLRSATKREILVRMLRNLEGVYRDKGERVNRLAALTGMLTFSPDLPDERYARGLLYRELDYVPAALQDLRRFVEVSNDGEKILYATRLIKEMGGRSVRIH